MAGVAWFPIHRYRLHLRWVMLSLVLLIVPSNGTAGDSRPGDNWPVIQSGIWETECTRTLPNGKTQHWSEVVSECGDATELLRGYWGLGAVEAAGCRYDAVKVSADQFKITSECMVLHAGVARSSAIALVKSGGAFEERVDVFEGKKVYHGLQIGRRRAACPEPARSK
jgi:hypothetical protein